MTQSIDDNEELTKTRNWYLGYNHGFDEKPSSLELALDYDYSHGFKTGCEDRVEFDLYQKKKL